MSALCWHFACLQMSTLCKFVSLMEHYQCFPSEDMCLIFVLGSVSRNTVPWGVFPNTPPREQECHVIQYHPCCQWISRNTSLQCGEYWQSQNQYYNDERMADIQTSAHEFMSKTSYTRYSKYPMIFEINRVRIGYWKTFRVPVAYRVIPDGYTLDVAGRSSALGPTYFLYLLCTSGPVLIEIFIPLELLFSV